MTETVKRRRRWPWVAVPVVLLFAGGPIAYRLRPLSNAEKAIVGDWHVHYSGGVLTEYLNFKADRTVVNTNELVGSWSVSASAISIRFPTRFHDYAGKSWPNQVYSYLRSRLPASVAYRWEGPDQFCIGETRFVRIRYD